MTKATWRAILLLFITGLSAQQANPQSDEKPKQHHEVVAVLSSAFRPCAIVQAVGKNYRWVEGSVPLGIPDRKKFTAADLGRIKAKNGVVEVLGQGAGYRELASAESACIDANPPARSMAVENKP